MSMEPTASSYPDPYGSHVPVLAAVAQAFHVRSVVEFGAGKFSTSAFLDRALFPDLERLISVETNGEWATSAGGDDPRHRMMLCERETDFFSSEVSEAAYDLAFVDGPLETRPLIIPAASALAPLVVVHDAEQKPLNELLLATYRHVVFFVAWNDRNAKEHPEPWTALCTNEHGVALGLGRMTCDHRVACSYAA
jgi:hypothetical protein